MAEMIYTCWICKGPFPIPFAMLGPTAELTCGTCGVYSISASLYASALRLPDTERYRLSAWCRQHNVEGRQPAELSTYSMDAIVAQLPNPRQSSKPDLFLLSLSKLFPEPGHPLALNWDTDYPLAYARPGGEIKYHSRALKARGYVEGDGSGSISLAGWERIDQLEGATILSKVAFAAMHFTDEMIQMWKQAIAPAIEKAGFEPLLANHPQHNERIDAKIMTDIKRSRFVVADVTGARTGVYFEAGYAMGLGRPVIWTCRESNKQDMHFDTRQYNHILWNDAQDLREQLYYRIMATI